ncbi:MATE family efflux transporter [Pseudoalteromonas denitrificans]|uniref:Multidrug-efflux transporter n=1 Tax=Pseudoalteromonas denitrificans DSM 6059 TaxID=1123010 RepID=A0A1I1NZW0_9GAMM|nr:MATE family efflux transporter [Pseudoalteromonas denitrificans]SFD01028.1 multidrug resistance protein, MATE family [Pseudoalteromonas denitrificans DSM 6059]
MRFCLWEAKYLLRLAIPVFFAQVILVLMGVVDTIMAGQVSQFDLAALSIASGLWNPILLSLQGILLALTGIVAHLFGAKRITDVRIQFHQALYLSIILSLFGLFLINQLHLIIGLINIEPQVIELTLAYLNYVKWGLPGFLIYCIFRNVSEGMTLTKPALYISIIGLAVNIPTNYIFIYGKLGLPELGGAGCGIATAIVFWCMALSQIIYTYSSKKLQGKFLLSQFKVPDLSIMASIFKMGIPISLATFFEVTLFACIPLFIANLGAVVVSGHQVAASVSTVLFMMPLSLSMAICIRVGNLYGQKQYKKLKSTIFTSFLLAIAISIIVASSTFLGRTWISTIYSDVPEVIALASSILILACFYQLPDAIQVAANGVLRGLKYTTPISYITFISYWLIGFSFGYVLGKTNLIVSPMGAQGFWLGIIIGLSVASFLMILTVKNRLTRTPFNNGNMDIK